MPRVLTQTVHTKFAIFHDNPISRTTLRFRLPSTETAYLNSLTKTGRRAQGIQILCWSIFFLAALGRDPLTLWDITIPFRIAVSVVSGVLGWISARSISRQRHMQSRIALIALCVVAMAACQVVRTLIFLESREYVCVTIAPLLEYALVSLILLDWWILGLLVAFYNIVIPLSEIGIVDTWTASMTVQTIVLQLITCECLVIGYLRELDQRRLFVSSIAAAGIAMSHTRSRSSAAILFASSPTIPFSLSSSSHTERKSHTTPDTPHSGGAVPSTLPSMSFSSSLPMSLSSSSSVPPTTALAHLVEPRCDTAIVTADSIDVVPAPDPTVVVHAHANAHITARNLDTGPSFERWMAEENSGVFLAANVVSLAAFAVFTLQDVELLRSLYPAVFSVQIMIRITTAAILAMGSILQNRHQQSRRFARQTTIVFELAIYTIGMSVAMWINSYPLPTQVSETYMNAALRTLFLCATAWRMCFRPTVIAVCSGFCLGLMIASPSSVLFPWSEILVFCLPYLATGLVVSYRTQDMLFHTYLTTASSSSATPQT